MDYILTTEGQNIFFTSDTHFGHANILKYCSRPFSSVEEMDNALIENWNRVVKKDDIVFHLGDFAFCGSQRLKELISSLNGRKSLIIGNHDRKMLRDGSITLFDSICSEMYISVNGQRIYLNHKPYLCFDGSYGRTDKTHTWQLFGHVHSGPLTKSGLDCNRLNMLFPTQYDVGVDNNNFTPISFDAVKEIIEEQLMSQNLCRGSGNQQMR